LKESLGNEHWRGTPQTGTWKRSGTRGDGPKGPAVKEEEMMENGGKVLPKKTMDIEFG